MDAIKPEASEILDGIVEHLRTEHSLTIKFTGWWFGTKSSHRTFINSYSIEIGAVHYLVLYIRSGFLLLEEYDIDVSRVDPIWKRSYELSNPAALDRAIKVILEEYGRSDEI